MRPIGKDITKHYHICNGGCVFMPEINQCKNNDSDLLEIV